MACKITRIGGAIEKVLAENGNESHLYKALSKVSFLTENEALTYYYAALAQKGDFVQDENGEPIVMFAAKTPENSLLLPDAIVHSSSIQRAWNEDVDQRGVEMVLVKSNEPTRAVVRTDLALDVAKVDSRTDSQILARDLDGTIVSVSRNQEDIVELAYFAPASSGRSINTFLNNIVNEGLVEAVRKPMSEVVRQTIRAVRRVSTESGNKALNELGEGKIELASPARLYKVESPAVEEVEGTFTTTTATKEGQIDIPAGTVVEHIHIDKKKSDRTTEESEVVTFQVEPMADNETSIISVVDNNRVGSLTLVPTEGGYRVNTISVSPEYQGNNIAKEMYREANEKLEGQIFSDVVQTEAAAGVWNSLVETGEATALEDGTFVMTEPKEVEVTEETSKELRDLPKKDLKQLERDAVQNSDAQVVKLVTRVGNKDVTQYIVKDDVLRLSIEETTDQVANQEIMNLDFEISRLIESGQIEATCKL
jgi:mRNA-degrading endonuclease RelE of RelBE toxin-antitoxin system